MARPTPKQTKRDPREAAALRARKAPEPPKPSKYLAALLKAGPHAWAAMVFWKMRRQLPEMSVTLTEREVEAMEQSFKYQEIKPKLVPRALQGYFVVQLADERTEDPVQAYENNEADFREQQQAKEARAALDRLPGLVAAVRGEMAQGITSKATIDDALDCAAKVANFMRTTQ